MSIDSLKTLEALGRVLKQERRAVLNGRIDRLGGLLDEKEMLVDQMRNLSENTPGLADARQVLELNQSLLAGALRGLRDVSDRLREMQEARQSLRTYDRRGRQSDIAARTKGSVEKRA